MGMDLSEEAKGSKRGAATDAWEPDRLACAQGRRECL